MTEPEALQSVVMARIRQLIQDRQWYRNNRWAEWSELRKEGETELRSLVKLVRMSRKLAAAAPDPMAAYGSFRDWSESEKAEAWGR